MKLKGHSKFNLELIKNKSGYFVKKSDGERLSQQCDKQSTFHNLIDAHFVLSHLFTVPNVETKAWEGEHFSFIMKFYNGKSILDILEKGDITILDDLINKLFLYLQWEFDNSSLAEVESYLQWKLLTLQEKIKDNDLSRIILKIATQCRNNNTEIPVGLCHGDFTFSNMIFSHKIVLIDFLDSFIESPLQDCAKLLQSVNLKWELLMDGGEGRDLTKIKIGYEYLRWQITQKMINTFPDYAKMIELFYAITLLRIIPYTTNKVIYDTVVQEIERIKL